MYFAEASLKLNNDGVTGIRREIWGENKFLILVPGSTFKVNQPPLNIVFKKRYACRPQHCPPREAASSVLRIHFWK